MSMKQELVQWDAAAKAFDAGDLEQALELLQPIADSSKIHFNMGMALQALGAHEEAIAAFTDAVQCDNYMSIGYMQKGVSHYILGEMDAALDSFYDAFIYLRGNYLIDYTQLGMEYKLYSCEVLYNRALVYFQLGDDQSAMADLAEASNAKQLPEHAQIDEAIAYRGDACQIFQVPANLIFKPPPEKVKNAGKKDYLGNSKVVAAVDASDNFATFNNLSINTTNLDTAPANIASATITRPRGDSVPSPKIGGGAGTIGRSGNRPRARTDAPRPVGDFATDTVGALAPAAAGGSGGGGGRYNTVGRMGSGRSNTMQSMRSPPDMPMRSVATAPRPSRQPERNLSPLDEGERALPPPPRRGSENTYARDRNNSNNDRDRESYGSNEYQGGSGGGGGGMSAALSTRSSMVPNDKLRVKVHFSDEKRMILLPGDATFDELTYKIQEKFNTRSLLKIRFRDEDGELVLMTDDDDLEVARSIGNNFNKLDVYCD
ncbi:hypothetical protein RI367_003174 [Sorochytrium milnesiophthora]